MEMRGEALDAGDAETLGAVEQFLRANGKLGRRGVGCRAARGSDDCLEHGAIEFEPPVNNGLFCSPVGPLRGMSCKRECGDSGIETVSATGWSRNGKGNPYLLFQDRCWGEGKAPSSRVGGFRGGAYVYVGDDVNAVEGPVATEAPESLRRLAEAVDRPVLGGGNGGRGGRGGGSWQRGRTQPRRGGGGWYGGGCGDGNDRGLL